MTKIYKKVVSMGSFLKKGVDFKEGDLVTIANEGKQVEGQFGSQDIFLIKTEDGKEGNVSFNSTTINGLIDGFGEDATQWIGKKVKAWKVKQNVAGKFLDVWYFSHPDAELTENGFVLDGVDVPKRTVKGKKTSNDDIPVIEEGEEEISVADIPF